MRIVKLLFIAFLVALPVHAQLFGGQIKPKNALFYKYPTGSVFCSSGPTSIVDITNPNTGKIWMDRNLGAFQRATSTTDTNSFGDLYQWGRGNDGHQCRNSASTTTLSSADQPGTNLFIQSSGVQNDWRNPQNNNLWQGVNGINNPCPSGYRIPTIQELELEANTWLNLNSLFKPTLGGSRRDDGNTSIRTVYWSSTIRANYLQAMTIDSSNPLYDVNDENRSRGFSVRCIKEIVGSIVALNCGSTTLVGNLISGIEASSVSASVPYTGGNSGYYAAQKIYSTGVTGLTATISQGLFANGAGNLIYTITGTPISSGTASFAINIGGQTCILNLVVEVNFSDQYAAGTVFCASGPTAIVDIVNPSTGKTWMDRNLGASQRATSATDTNSYGDLYQWGRGSDGHQCRNSLTTTTLSSSDQPSNNKFIVTGNNDWRTPSNSNLWQGLNGINNPCPSGYRIPTQTELSEERLSWNSIDSNGAFSSPLKFSMAGFRHQDDGNTYNVGNIGFVWAYNRSGDTTNYLDFGVNASNMSQAGPSNGRSVRCIKDISAIIGTVANINCGTATNTGTLRQDSLASGVNSSIPYTGGNGGSHTGQTVNSTGVSGLTATLSSGIFAYGAGTLTYNISGIPTSNGTASFAINIGGQTCTLNLTVEVNLITQYTAGSVFCTSGPTAIVDVTNPTTGKIWMDRNLGATQAATSATDSAAYGDLYQWGRGSDGHQCRNSLSTTTLSSTDQPGNNKFIKTTTNSDWRSTVNNDLWQGINGINNPCPSGYRIPTRTELIDERASWGSDNSNGAFSSPLKFTMGGFRQDTSGTALNVGNIGFVWSSTLAGAIGNRRGTYIDFNTERSDNSIAGLANGRSVRCIKDASAIIGTLANINCGSATNTGTLSQDSLASGVNSSIPYTGGNGGSHTGQTVNSTGVSGLTATLSSGIFAYGSGSLVYTISGIPSTSGTASFVINIGNQTCTLNLTVGSSLITQYAAGSVFCASGPTAIVDVTNPTTGKTWMDRNLGATQAATSATDSAAYGDLYQWGRGNDGHQCRNSTTTTTLSSSDQPGNGNFILTTNTPYDWRSPENTTLWLGINGTNNPCPINYRLPTDSELNLERLSWSSNNSSGAFISPLKLPMAGARDGISNSYLDVDANGLYWSGTISGSPSYSRNLGINSAGSDINGSYRSRGYSLRCIKN